MPVLVFVGEALFSYTVELTLALGLGQIMNYSTAVDQSDYSISTILYNN